MAGTVYLRTNRFEVKLEGITFKTRDFESLCMLDFLFPKGKVWLRPPIVGVDVMRHPRDPTIMLLLLCFGVGCMILRFHCEETLPEPILKFLSDERICFVGFGIPEKKDLFPFEELGLKKSKVDIGYLAAKFFKDPKFKRCELAKLARKVLGVKKMVGLTEASSFERHEQMKCAICQLFITSVIAMKLLHPDNKKKLADPPKKGSFLKNLNSLPLLNEGWFKLPKGKKDNNKSKGIKGGNDVQIQEGKEANLDYYDVHAKGKDGSSGDDSVKESVSSSKKPLKGILKCPSLGLESCNLSPPKEICPPSTSKGLKTAGCPYLKRANSKGCNVSFK